MDLLQESNRLSSEIANSFRRVLTEAPEPRLRIIAIYAGRFQPFHAGNYKIYKQLLHQFGRDNVFIATSDQLHPKTGSALSYSDKKYIINNMFPIGESRVFEVNDPFFPKEILSHFDEKSTAFVLTLSDKDIPLISDQEYFHLYVSGLQIKPLVQAGYYMPVPDAYIHLGNTNVPLDNVGQIFSSPKLSGEAKQKLFKQLYGRDDEKALQILSGSETAQHSDRTGPEKTIAKDRDTEYGTPKRASSDSEAPKKDVSKPKPHPALKNVSMDSKIINPETNKKIKLGSALKYPREKLAYKKAVKIMQAAGKDRPDRAKDPIVNRAWTDRSVKRRGYADSDVEDTKSENTNVNEIAISLANEFARKLSDE